MSNSNLRKSERDALTSYYAFQDEGVTEADCATLALTASTNNLCWLINMLTEQFRELNNQRILE